MLDEAAIQRLREIESATAPGLVRDLCLLFLREFPRKLAAMEAAGSTNHLTAVLHEVHPLKASCGHLGARELQRLCQEIEEACIAGEPGKIPALLELLGAGYPAVKARLSAEAARSP